MSKEYIDIQSKKYRALLPCYCLAIDDTVHFRSDELHHLKYKKRRPRKHTEVHYRMTLIDYIVDVIENSTQATRELDKAKPEVVLWSLRHVVDEKIIKVILRKEKGGKVHFLSVMEEKRQKNTKTKS